MNTPIYADLDQIVFEGRSKEYGAYQMRKRYNRVLTRASLIAFLLFLAVTGLPKVVTWIMPKHGIVANDLAFDTKMTEVNLPPKTEPKTEPIPAMPAAPKPPMKTVAVLLPVPTADDDVKDDETIKNNDDLDKAVVSLKDEDGDTTGYDFTQITDCPECPIEGGETVIKTDSSDVPPIDKFMVLDKEPQPVNIEDLRNAIGYPKMAVEADIEGKVIVRVLVDKHGDYMRHKVLKDPHPILTNAVAQKINMLKMTPGIQAGKPIPVWVTLPFDFQLMK